MKENYVVNTHNQVVPGSSPAGPTLINKALSEMEVPCCFWDVTTFSNKILGDEIPIAKRRASVFWKLVFGKSDQKVNTFAPLFK